MDFSNKVLVVDDNVGSVMWLIDFLEWRGYEVDHVTNEKAAREKIAAVHRCEVKYILAIFDIMIAIMDVKEINDFDDEFYEKSSNAGIRLCRQVRKELGMSEEQLPVVCISARDDEELRQEMAELGIPLFKRTDEGIREFLRSQLPKLR